MEREQQNALLKRHGYRWEKITQDWLDDNDDFETRPGWHLYAPKNRGEVTVERALREIEIGVEETEREYQAARAREFEIWAKSEEIKKLRAACAAYIQNHGTRPDRQPNGETILDTANIYGGGNWFVVGENEIWYCQNNGMDGDSWSNNNVRTGGAGAIGWVIPTHDQILLTLTCLKNNMTPARYRIHNGEFRSAE